MELSYKEFLYQIKQQIKNSQIKAALSVNSQLIVLYWNTGKIIAENQALFEGRNNYIEQLSIDIKNEFPGINGFSKRNLFDIRRFYLFYSENSVRQLVALKTEKDNEVSGNKPVLSLLVQIPWGHHLMILNKVKAPDAAFFYIQQILENNWSRSILGIQIEQNLFTRQGKSINNFRETLPEKQALMAQQILKDPYNFDFITLEAAVQEKDLEKQLILHITNFLLELGKGFAFIGRQYNLLIGENDYYLDLLFYHIRLRCFVVVELKVVEFQPEFAGKMNFYLSAVDDLLKAESDQQTIGILLCKNKNKIEVEYALRDINKPIGVSDFTFTEILPDELKSSIPTVEEFEQEMLKLAEVNNKDGDEK